MITEVKFDEYRRYKMRWAREMAKVGRSLRSPRALDLGACPWEKLLIPGIPLQIRSAPRNQSIPGRVPRNGFAIHLLRKLSRE